MGAGGLPLPLRVTAHQLPRASWKTVGEPSELQRQQLGPTGRGPTQGTAQVDLGILFLPFPSDATGS